MLGLTWMALVLTVTVELTWNLSSKTFSLTHIHTYLPFLCNINTCTQEHTHNHTRHDSHSPTSLLQSSTDPAYVSRSGNSATTRWLYTVFVTKIITKIMIWKEQHDEHDSNHLLYSPAQLHLFFVSCPTSACWPIKSVDLKWKRKKAFGFYFIDSQYYWYWNWYWDVKNGTDFRLRHHINHTCYISWDVPDWEQADKPWENKYRCSKWRRFFVNIQISFFLFFCFLSDGSECTRGFKCRN